MACTSGDGNRKRKIFFKSPFLHQASSSRRDRLHPLSIVLCIAATSAFVTLVLSKAAAIAPVSSIFFLLYIGLQLERGCNILGESYLPLVAVTVGYIQVFLLYSHDNPTVGSVMEYGQ